MGSELSPFFGDSSSCSSGIFQTSNLKQDSESIVIQFPAKKILLNQQVEATVSVKVKGEEEAGLPSDRIMVGGFSQVLTIKKSQLLPLM